MKKQEPKVILDPSRFQPRKLLHRPAPLRPAKQTPKPRAWDHTPE